jgi:hypothetical protein
LTPPIGTRDHRATAERERLVADLQLRFEAAGNGLSQHVCVSRRPATA